MPESRFHAPLFVVLLICGASVLLGSCGTGPEPPELSEIARVEITPEPVTTHYTAVFTLVVADSLGEPYRVAWQLARPDGSALDTLTDTQRFYWTAPSQPGEYTHSVRLETVEGEPLSEEYSFAAEVVPWNPPPADTTLRGKIVFSAQDSIGQSQIFTMNADGTNLQQLTDWERGSTQPSWSPDGQQIVFASGRNGSAHTPALWVMDADGGNPHLLHSYPGSSFPLLGSKPRWSPNGEKIVYDRYDGFQMDIYVYDISAGERRQLTDHDADDNNPAWSPYEYRIAFISDREYERDDGMPRKQREIYVMNANGSNIKRITTDFSGGFIWMSPDKIIITKTDKDTQLKDVFILNTESKNTEFILEKIATKRQLWVFWNRKNRRLMTINKDHNRLPVILTSYDLSGNLLDQLELNIEELSSAVGFSWYFNK